MTFEINEESKQEMGDWLAEKFGEIPSRISSLNVSEYVEGTRKLPPGTPRPGAWSNSYTPYLVEIMDCFSVRSPINRVILAKAAQIGATAAAENVLAYYMDEVPSAILMMSATGVLLEKWSKKRLDPLIDSCDFRQKIGVQSNQAKSRRSGDTATSKEFPGGFLEMASANSAASMRSDSIKILIRDEIDGAPSELKTGEGNWLQVSMARTSAFGDKSKVFDFSTPTTEDESVIWPEYLEGDQRKYFVPCPHCGTMQDLIWKHKSDLQKPGGLTYELDHNGILDKVYYECSECLAEIFEHEKDWLLKRGQWRPTATSIDPLVRSYHINALYSPLGMKSWRRIVTEFLKAKDDTEKMRAFVNLNLGLPFKETGTRPRFDVVESLRGNYKSGTIPNDDILFLTMAIDVQRGSQKDEENPPRLELEVCAHGAGYRTWSIDYVRIEGAIDDPFAGAYEELNELAIQGRFTYTREDGKRFEPVINVIDSGDGEFTDVVYAFAASWPNTLPLKGFGNLKKQKDNIEIGDETNNYNFDRYRFKPIGDIHLLQVHGNYYKRRIYQSLKIPYQHAEEQKPGFCAFPRDYGKKYFKMLTAEELRSDGSFYHGGRRNEALDCRVYNLAARDFWLESKVTSMRKEAKKRGCTEAQVAQIDSASALNLLRKTINRNA